MSNPFSREAPSELVNICSGILADEETTSDMLNAYSKGDEKVEDFINSKILCEQPDIFSKIKTMRLRTFKSMAKPTTAKTASGALVPIKNDCRFWARLVLIAKNRSIDLEEVFSYTLRTYPRALATDNGGLNKTAKSKLLHVLEQEAEVPLVEEIPATNTATIVDAMALLQMMNAKEIPETFGELADSILKKVIGIAVKNQSSRIDFVSDRYPPLSTKNAERLNRAVLGTQAVAILGGIQRVPKQWKKFLNLGSNKEGLIEFLVNHWRNAPSSVLQSTELFVTKANTCYRFKSSGSSIAVDEIPALECDHEEADTKMFVHAQHAAISAENIIIKSPDTDVFIIALGCQVSIPANLVFDTGTGNKRRRIDIGEVAAYFGPRWCRAMIGFHIFTGNVYIL